MFTTIRGIPLHKLEKSGFCQAIRVLAESWRNRHGTNPINQSSGAHYLASFLAILICLLFVAGYCDAKKEVVWMLITVVSLMVGLTAIVAVFARNFVGAVNLLDSILVKNGYGGLPVFPASWVDINDYLGEVCFKIILLLRLHEREFGTMDPKVAKQRKLLRKFKATVDRLGFALMPYDYYFQKANLQLDREEAERKKTATKSYVFIDD